MYSLPQILSWLAEASAYKQHLTWFVISLYVVGIFLNGVVIDVSFKLRDQTSGTKWMRLLAFWDIAFLLVGLAKDILLQIAGNDIRDASNVSCKVYHYFQYLGAVNASAHLVMLAVDRAINITFPTWHYKRDWNKLTPRISLTITFLYIILLSPLFFVVNLQDGVCATKTEMVYKIYQNISVGFFFVISHFSLLLTANIIFVHELRKRKTPKVLRQHSNTNAIKNKNTGKPVKKQNPNGNTKRPYPKDDIKTKKEVGSGGETQPVSVLVDFIYCGPNTPATTNYNEEKEEAVIEFDESVTSFVIPGANLVSVASSSSTSMGSKSNIDLRTSSTIINFETNFAQSDSKETKTLESKVSNIKKDIKEAVQKKQEDEGEKPAPQLTPEDVKAVRTVLYICAWYFFSMFSGMSLIIFERRNDELQVPVAKFIDQAGSALLILNNCFNFFFYLRGKSFRNAFKSKYLW